MTVWSQTFQSRATNRYFLVSSKGISRAYLPGSLSPYEQQQILKKGERQSALETAPGGTWLSHHLSITTLRAQTLFASHLLRWVLGTQGPTEQHTVAAFTHFTDKRRTETKWQVALGYDDKCVTNSSEHTMGGYLAHPLGLREDLPWGSEPGKEEGRGTFQEAGQPCKGLGASEDAQCTRTCQRLRMAMYAGTGGRSERTLERWAVSEPRGPHKPQAGGRLDLHRGPWENT